MIAIDNSKTAILAFPSFRFYFIACWLFFETFFANFNFKFKFEVYREFFVIIQFLSIYCLW